MSKYAAIANLQTEIYIDILFQTHTAQKYWKYTNITIN